MGGQRRRTSSAMNNPAALLNSVAAGKSSATGDPGGSTVGGAAGYLIGTLAMDKAMDFNRFSPDTIKMLTTLKSKHNQNKGKVIIKDENN